MPISAGSLEIRSQILSLEGTLRRADRRRERPAAPVGVGFEPGQGHAAGGPQKKSLRPAQEREFDLWAYANGVVLDFSRPGKPTDNAFIESFNARIRLECLNQHWFLNLDDARKKIELWRQDYKDVRAHSAIGERPPMIVFIAHRNGPMSSTVPEALV